jgi:hypothetical protein
MEHNNQVFGGKIAWDLTSYIAGGGGVGKISAPREKKKKPRLVSGLLDT